MYMSKSMAKVPDGCWRSILRSYSGTTVSSFAASRSSSDAAGDRRRLDKFRFPVDAWLTVSRTHVRGTSWIYDLFFLQRKIHLERSAPKVKRYEDDGAEFLRTVLDGIQEKSDRATSVEVEGQGYWRLPVHKTHALAFLVRSISLCNFGEISGMVVVLRSWFIKCDSCDISKTIYHPHHYYYYHSHYQSRYPLLALWLWSLLWKPSLLS